MSGTLKGSLKKKLGLKGKTKPGDMIYRMNKMKGEKPSIKKSGTYKGKSNKSGGGGRFAQVVSKVSKEKGVYDPKGLAAYIGRKSLGNKKMAKLAAAGKKRG